MPRIVDALALSLTLAVFTGSSSLLLRGAGQLQLQSEPISLGCYAVGEEAESRPIVMMPAMPANTSTLVVMMSANMTPEHCFDFCLNEGQEFMMIQHGTQCACGDIAGAVALMRNGSATCDLACPGDGNQTCGGEASFELFYTGATPSNCTDSEGPTLVPSPAPEPAPEPAPGPAPEPSDDGPGSPTPAPTPPSSSGGFEPWPEASGSVKISATIILEEGETLDGDMVRYYGIGDGSQNEGQDPMFRLEEGATLRNVIIGAPAGDGVHCYGSCLIENVWWEDVGEDAGASRGSTTGTMTISGGGARNAEDKIFNHNSAGTMVVKDFQADGFGKLVRSCGDCEHKRKIVIEHCKLSNGKVVAGVNVNFGDVAEFSDLDVDDKEMKVCEWYDGAVGGSSEKLGNGPNSHCIYDPDTVFE